MLRRSGYSVSRLVRVLIATGVAGPVLVPSALATARPPPFAPATSFAAGINPVSVVSGDLNGDSKPDLAVANGGSNTVSVLLGTGTGSLRPAAHLLVRPGDQLPRWQLRPVAGGRRPQRRRQARSRGRQLRLRQRLGAAGHRYR